MTTVESQLERLVILDNSLVFPALKAGVATQFLDESEKLKSTAWLRQVRAWARAQKS